MSIDSTIRKAQTLSRAGDLDGATRLLKQVLAKAPGNTAAQRGLAAIARIRATSGGAARPASGPSPRDIRAAEALLTRPDAGPALAEAQRLALLYPKAPEVQNLLGLALSRAGKPAEAIKAFNRFAELRPKSAPARVNLANILLATGQFDAAAGAAAEARSLDPRLARAAQLEGFALSRAGHHKAAETAFRDAIRLAPKDPAHHLGLGHALAAKGTMGDALPAYEAALALAPENIDAANNTGAALIALRRSDDAVTVLAPAIERAPAHRMLRSNMAKALRDLGRADEAVAHVDAALAAGPESAALMAIKASCLSMTGDFDAALPLLDRAETLDPENVELHVLRSQIAPETIDQAARERMAATLADETGPAQSRAALAFALFKAFDRAGEVDAAADCLVTGNRLRRSLRPYDMTAEAHRMKALSSMFRGTGPVLSEEDIAEAPSPHRLVFIVGMPRSGTTLVEQILASHPDVHGAGELRLLDTAMEEIGATDGRAGHAPTRDALLTLRKTYIDGITKRGIEAAVVTDKMPLNFRYLGHALAAFPDARALVLDRDARAVCWSNWSHDFHGRSNGFGNDFKDVARMYHLHRELVAAYRVAYPERIATVPYERLTEQQEDESRKLVAAAGLDWDPACLQFHETRRAVRTASASQVRQEMYTGSSQAWQRYEAHLAPLLAALDTDA